MATHIWHHLFCILITQGWNIKVAYSSLPEIISKQWTNEVCYLEYLLPKFLVYKWLLLACRFLMRAAEWLAYPICWPWHDYITPCHLLLSWKGTENVPPEITLLAQENWQLNTKSMKSLGKHVSHLIDGHRLMDVVEVIKPIPAASWLDLCAWDHDNFLSYQSAGITSQLKTTSVNCLVRSTPSSPAAFSISAMMPDRPAALLHFILLSALQIRLIDILGGGPAVGGTSGSSLLGHINSTLSNVA